MVKKISMLALAGLIALPVAASAGARKAPADLENKIDELSRQLDALKAQLAQQNEAMTAYGDKVNAMDEMLGEKSEAWDLAARIKLYGDFRARADYYNASNLFDQGTPLRMTGMTPTGMPTFAYASTGDESNDTLFTNRFRLNMRAKATENIEFKGRLAMYKAWGMQSTPEGLGNDYPIFDGNVSRQPDDSALYVDRAFANWNNIAGSPAWFSVGRRPTTDGPPAEIRMNNTERMATPVAYMDYPFDGISLGYAYNWGIEPMGTGRIRFCYGRGFENGLQGESAADYIDDTDFAGFSWDVMKKGSRFMNIQSFGVANLFNYPNFRDSFINYAASFPQEEGGYGARVNVGNMYHTSAVFQDKVAGLNYFVAGGWSRSDPNGAGMFNDYAMMGMMEMMGYDANQFTNSESEDGYSFYAGVRYDIENAGVKLGAEYNYGSQYWVSFSPGHDDMYQSKLATRGSAYELYMIYDLPTGEAISKYAQTFIRLGYQYLDYDYAGGFDWNMKPYDLEDDKFELQMLGLNPVDDAHAVYLTFEVYF